MLKKLILLGAIGTIITVASLVQPVYAGSDYCNCKGKKEKEKEKDKDKNKD